MKKSIIAAIASVLILGYMAGNLGTKDRGSELGQPKVTASSTKTDKAPIKAAVTSSATEPEKVVADIVDANRSRRAKLAERLKALYAQYPHSEIQSKAIELRARENRLFLGSLGHSEAVIQDADTIVRKRDEELGNLRVERLTNPAPYNPESIQKSEQVQTEAKDALRRVLGDASALEFEKWEASRKSQSSKKRASTD